VALVAVTTCRAGLSGMPGLRVDGGDDPIPGDPTGDLPAPRPLAGLDILAGDQRQQRDRLGLGGVKPDIGQDAEHGQRVIDQPRHQRLGGLWIIPSTHRLARPVIVMAPKLDLARLRNEPTDPADRRDQLGDRVLGRDRILQDRGVQHPPTSTRKHPGGLHHLADGVEDPPWPGRGADAAAPIHQHGGVETLIVKAQPTGDLPGDVAPQRADGLPVRQALQGLQHHHRRDHLGRHRGVAATLASQVGQQPGWEQLVAMVGQEGVHRPLRDQVAAPGRRVQLVIGGMALGAHARESAPPTPAARTTGSTQPTESAEPRPFSRLLGGQPGSPRTPGRARRGCSSRTGRKRRSACGWAGHSSIRAGQRHHRRKRNDNSAPAAIQCMSPSARISALMAGRTLLSLCCRARATHTKDTCMRNIPWDVLHLALQEVVVRAAPPLGSGSRSPRRAASCQGLCH
jgi:hypothetical protein